MVLWPPLFSAESRMRMVFARAVGLAVLLGFAASLTAQDGSTGAIRGIVVDPSGARVVGAKVLIINPDTASARRVTTDAEGRFSADLLPPGSYDLTANANAVSKSFAVVQRKNIQVEVGGAVELELKLTLAAGETVEVSGATQLV